MKIVKSLLLAVVFALTTTGCATTTSADTRVGVGIHLDLFPDLHPVPGYPVYYAPNVSANLFFYDGAYWLYGHDGWYVSDWYNGPWDYVEPDYVPWFVLRVPVRYYRAPPPYFRGWYHDAPPRWGHYWGPGWSHRHNGWDHWDRSYVPRRAPLPTYQRDYRGNRYPDYQRQRDLQKEHYRYRSQDPRYNKYRDDHRGNDRQGKDRQRDDRQGYDNRGNDRYDNNRYGNDRYRNENRGSEGRDRPTVYQTPQRDVKPRGPEGAQFERSRESRESGNGGLRMQDGRPNGYESRGFSQPQRPQQEQRERPSREQQRREQPAPEQSGREFNPRQDRGGWQQAPRQQQSAPPQQQQYQQPQQQSREYRQPQREYQQPQQRQRMQVESRGEGRQQMRNGELGGGRNQERGWPGHER